MVSVLFCAGSEHSNMDITHILTSPWFRILAILLGGLVVTWLTNLFSRRIIRATMRQIPIASQRDDKERDAMRQQRAQAMEQARQLEMAKGVAEAANNSTAPAELLASMGQQNVAPLPLPPLAPAGQ